MVVGDQLHIQLKSYDFMLYQYIFKSLFKPMLQKNFIIRDDANTNVLYEQIKVSTNP